MIIHLFITAMFCHCALGVTDASSNRSADLDLTEAKIDEAPIPNSPVNDSVLPPTYPFASGYNVPSDMVLSTEPSSPPPALDTDLGTYLSQAVSANP